MKLTVTGVGTADSAAVRDTQGSGLLPIQAAKTGAATFQVLGKVSPEAPWVEVIASGSVDFLQSISWVPFLRLEITAGAGTVDLWVGDN